MPARAGMSFRTDAEVPAMNFFAQQEIARKQTRRMIVLFSLAVAVIVVAVNAIVAFALGLAGTSDTGEGGLNVAALGAVTVVVLAVIGLATLYRVATLRGGGGAVALQMGATQVPSDTTHFAYRRLRNVVEEIAIASGVPVPEIYVLEQETAINAFASGYTPADAAVTVTRGCIDKLTRDELQGVIAHEFSHVLNGDMRLNIRLMGVAFGILVIAIVGRKIAQTAGYSRSRDSAGIALVGIGLLVVGYIGVFFARLIKASIARQREFLADASAVQFTRQTDGIAGALKKIGGLAQGSRLTASDGEEVAHMLFGDGVGYSALFATHPPLTDRIKRLQPSFDPAELAEISADWSQPRHVGDVEDSTTSIAGFAPARAHARTGHARRTTTLPSPTDEIAITPQQVVGQVGNPDTADYAAAASLNLTIPVALADAAHSREDAMALVFALVVGQDDVRARQLALIARYFDSAVSERVVELLNAAMRLHPMQRLPLAALAFPALRRQPRPQLQVFVIALSQLIEADGHITLDEYCLAKLVGLQVIDALNPSASRVLGRIKLIDVAAELADLFALVAAYGHDESNGARRAYALGMDEVLPGHRAAYAPPAEWANALDRALPRLDLLAPEGKQLVVSGLTLAISADGHVSVSEAELLRTVCAALHCPLPPLLQQTS